MANNTLATELIRLQTSGSEASSLRNFLYRNSAGALSCHSKLTHLCHWSMVNNSCIHTYLQEKQGLREEVARLEVLVQAQREKMVSSTSISPPCSLELSLQQHSGSPCQGKVRSCTATQGLTRLPSSLGDTLSALASLTYAWAAKGCACWQQ